MHKCVSPYMLPVCVCLEITASAGGAGWSEAAWDSSGAGEVRHRTTRWPYRAHLLSDWCEFSCLNKKDQTKPKIYDNVDFKIYCKQKTYLIVRGVCGSSQFSQISLWWGWMKWGVPMSTAHIKLFYLLFKPIKDPRYDFWVFICAHKIEIPSWMDSVLLLKASRP